MAFIRRAAKALIGTGVALAVTFGAMPSAFAEDALDTAKAELAQLQEEAFQVETDLNASKEAQAAAQSEYDVTTADLAEQQALVDQMRVQVGRVAIASHQQAAGLGSAALLFSADSEDSFLADMAIMQSVTAITDEQLTRLGAEQERLADLETAQQTALEAINAEVAEQEELSAEYEDKVARAERVVQRLTLAQQAALAAAANKAVLDSNAALLAGAMAEGDANRVSRDGLSLPSGSGDGVWPTPGPITSPFGYRSNPIGGYSELHDGVDIGAACGTPVRSSWTGVVLSARYEGGWGNRIIVDSGIYKGAYNHLQAMAVQPGEIVQAGQIIGAVGTTGYSTGCHLHYSTWANGQLADPISLF